VTAWTYEFEDGGGYDCMTDGVWVLHNRNKLFYIDLVMYGQKQDGSHTPRLAKDRAMAFASKIVLGLNERNVDPRVEHYIDE
jgi:hypothetical protein